MVELVLEPRSMGSEVLDFKHQTKAPNSLLQSGSHLTMIMADECYRLSSRKVHIHAQLPILALRG